MQPRKRLHGYNAEVDRSRFERVDETDEQMNERMKGTKWQVLKVTGTRSHDYIFPIFLDNGQ